jgi:hypothetical protein
MKFSHFGYLPLIFAFLYSTSARTPNQENVLRNLDNKISNTILTKKETVPLLPPPLAVIPIKKTLLNSPKNVPVNNLKVLVLGGGYSPSGNQVSLESNVKYFRNIRNNIGLGNAHTQTYFADGREKGRDLQFFDPKFRIPQINLVFAELFGKTKGIANQYRSNQLNPDGSSTLKSVDHWFHLQKKVTGNQKNIIYFTGHGGKGANKTQYDTTAYLWDNAKLKVSDFVKKLDLLPIQQSTILIMVQCYSGGFANVIFQDGDPKKELSKHLRAGFFSTIQSRVAAGCTPDIREENYQEYSTSFWEALSGVSRMGKNVKQPDFNSDGKTSLMEAHSYVSINSNTIDVPHKTSDVLLRKFLPDEFKKKKVPQKKTSIIGKYLPNLFKNDDLLPKNTEEIEITTITKADLLQLANPEEKAVFIGLSKKLGLKENIPDNELKSLVEKFKKEREEIQKKKKSALDQKNKYRDSLRKKLLSQYPEISNPYHPTTILLLSTDQKEEILETVKKEQIWEKLKSEKEKVESFESQRFAIEKKEVKIMRLKKCMENIILAHKLLQKASAEQINRYKQLLKLERTVLTKN